MALLKKLILLVAITLVTLLAVFLIPPFAQPLSFHAFADTRSIWGIPNFGNVVSNLPFLCIGGYGLFLVARSPAPFSIRSIYLLLFVGVMLTGMGSAYYHWHPDNDTLVWDRLPMTIVFMSVLCATLTELVNRSLGSRLLLPLVGVGIGSVVWWHYTERVGHGDLRLYMWVQFYPMIAIPLVLWLFYTPKARAMVPVFIWMVAWYVVAKVFEQLDYTICRSLGASGHSLKHLAAAVSTWYFVRLYRLSVAYGLRYVDVVVK